MKCHASVVALFIINLILASAGGVSGQQKYEEPEAYTVYNAVLATFFAREKADLKKLVFQAETGDFNNEENPILCLKPDPSEEPKLGLLLLAYKQANSSRRLLQPKLDIKLPFEFVPKATIDQIIGKNFDGWPAFYEKYPGSNGAIHMSAVGFNSDKSLALVYVGYWCGGLCGQGGWNLMEKQQGRWVQVQWKGQSCSWIS